MQTQHVDDYPGLLKMSASEMTAFWASVTNGIIGELMFKKEDEQTATDQEEDDDVDDAVVQAEMLAARAANSKRQAMDRAGGRVTAEAVGMTHRTCNIAKLAGVNDTIVGQWVRIHRSLHATDR
ncbi:hypothetical protein H257_11781 [Aphanomyces astaci]|uniref:Uncharacterized protein n=1 Tax=Aphanomyces astaci TaxID=112090 RepID=W4G2R5_APHAT|nr:hypothetical protein H257_11781 [Aphanomyces astaci]ETV73233.1 hypothetical protein H257_11781 [Aphanomyces astaci]|eukprot:XP_009837108.1 hypothetical protein H257_11781 [Aphanomyces astaci]